MLWPKDKGETLICVVILHAQANPVFLHLRACGLKEDALYRMEGTGDVYSGSALMYAGINLPVRQGDYQNINFAFQEIRNV